MRSSRRLARLVRDLSRYGYGVHPLSGGKRMSTNDVISLTQVVKEQVAELKGRTQQVRDELQANLSEARDTVEYVDGMSKQLKGAVSELKAALGQHTNGPPSEGTN